MRRLCAILGSPLFLVVAPGFIAGLVPWWISRCRFEGSSAWLAPVRFSGAVLVLCGIVVLLDSFARFAMQGLGTPAPIFPTRKLVITGLYRYVRNPMYVAVVSIISGQALLFANTRLLEYAAGVWLAFHLFVIGYEEPTLRSAFGSEYETFCSNIPRWIPRLRS